MKEEKLTISELKEVIERLEYHLKVYKEYKYDSKNASTKKKRNDALESMSTHADFMQSDLTNPDILNIIKEDFSAPFPFEDFWKYANSDVPGYIVKLNQELERRKKEEQEIDDKKCS